MSEQGSVNSQIVDSIADVVTLTNGLAPSNAFGMLDAVMTETLGMSMYNAVSRQQGGSMIGSAAATAVCAKMLSTSFPVPLPTPPPPPPPPPEGVQPLKPPPRHWPPPSAVIAAAAAEADVAIETLKAEAKGSSSDAEDARSTLERLAEEATPSLAAAVVTAANWEAEAAIKILQAKAKGISEEAVIARDSLITLGDEAKNPAPPRELAPDSVNKTFVEAYAAIELLKKETQGASPAAAAARRKLKKLAADAKLPPGLPTPNGQARKDEEKQ